MSELPGTITPARPENPANPETSRQEGQYEITVPVILDRVHQARVKNALEPEWEARFEPRSYGFRPGRCCQDAAEALYGVLRGRARRVWILDADLSAAFDKISHSFLLSQLGTFPARDMIAGWLRAGVFEAGKGFAPTEEGTPQGGIISPCLLNVALHGLEEAAGVRYRGGEGDHADHARNNSPVLVRYADDFVVCCFTEQQAHGVRERLEEWLAGRGLSLNQDKTRVVHLTQGFDFLGWTFRRYPSGKLLIKPSTAAIKKHRKRLAAEMRKLRGSNATAVIAALTPLIRGWAAYHRGMVSSEVFNALGNYMWKLTWKWARYSHPNKTGRWVTARYFGAFNPSRQDKWVSGDKQTGACLRNHSWTRIRRHVMVKGRHRPTTRTWQATGGTAGTSTAPRWTAPPRPCPAGNGAAARSAGTGSSTPATCPAPPRDGRTGGPASPSGPSGTHPARPASSPAPARPPHS
jgi:RNA-directed DNA polymerase